MMHPGVRLTLSAGVAVLAGGLLLASGVSPNLAEMGAWAVLGLIVVGGALLGRD